MANPDRNSFTRYDIEFPNSGLSEPPGVPKVEIRQAQGHHDVAVLSYPAKLENLHRNYKTGAPVRIRWRNRWGSNQFVGYVHHARAHFGSDTYSSSVVCVGASFPLISVKQRTFANSTADMVVKQIAAEHGLLAITEPHARVYESISQPAVSDWALLCRLATETGYVLRANQTSLIFMSRKSLEEQNKPMAQVFTMATGTATNTSSLSSVFDFDPIIGDYLPEIGISNTRKQVRATDPITGQTVTLEGGLGINDVSGVFTKPVVVANNTVQEASAQLDAAIEKNRYTYQARVRCVGSPVVSPDKFVYMRGVPKPYDGYWTVLSVTHTIEHTAQYLMDMQVGSEALNGAEPLPSDQLSEQARNAIVARDVGNYQMLRFLDSDSRLDTLSNPLEGFIGRAFSGAVWKSTRLTEV